MVARDSLLRHTLVIPEPDQVHYAPPHSSVNFGLFGMQLTSLPVGKIYHSRTPLLGRGHLIRTTVLEVCQTGRTQKSESPVLGWLRRLATD